MADDSRLGRRIPTSWEHVDRYPASALRMLATTVVTVERLMLPPDPSKYQRLYDQGAEGACVGFGESLLMSILNRRLYAASWLYHEAQAIDEYPETPPEAGTSLRAGFDVLREKGHRQVWAGITLPLLLSHGIVAVNRWLTTTDQGRTAISLGSPVVDGVFWYEAFYWPIEKRVMVNGRSKVEYWIPPREQWGRLVGAHCICRPGASDDRQAFAWLNSWGKAYPWPVYIDYDDHEWLLQQSGEAAVVTDR